MEYTLHKRGPPDKARNVRQSGVSPGSDSGEGPPRRRTRFPGDGPGRESRDQSQSHRGGTTTGYPRLRGRRGRRSVVIGDTTGTQDGLGRPLRDGGNGPVSRKTGSHC